MERSFGVENRFQNILEKIKTAAVNVGEGAAKGARRAGAVASDLVDSGKIKVKIADKKGDLKLLYLKLGEITYAKHAGEEFDPEKEQELYAKIESCKKNIAAFEAELERVKADDVCPNCAAKCKKGDEFCAACGAAIDMEADEE